MKATTWWPLAWHRESRENPWLRLHLLVMGIENIVLPALLIEMYEQDMRDMLTIFQHRDKVAIGAAADK